jgi:hypothetical protein
MKRTTLVLCLLVAAFASLPVLAREIAKVKLTSSGTTTSSTVGCGLWAVQGDAAFCVNSGATTATADCTLGTANSSVQVSASQLYDLDLPCSGPDAADTIAVVSVSGTANVQVWRVSLGR